MEILENKKDFLTSKTVYSFRPRLINEFINNLYKTEKFKNLHKNNHLNKQDNIHIDFANQYIKWSNPVVDMSDFNSDMFYPTSGSSEAIREVINNHSKNKTHKIHIFEGEYEGYKAYANSAGVEVVVHSRTPGYWEISILSSFKDGDLFILSNPNSFDGNFIDYFDDFIEFMEKNFLPESCSIAVDLAYIGTTDIPIESLGLRSKVIDYVFVSLSKSFGMYYNRIGGVFSKIKIDGLYGNKWFKNVESLFTGTKLMESFQVDFMFDAYYNLTCSSIRNISKEKGIKLKDFVFSDNYLIVNLSDKYLPYFNENEYSLRSEHQLRLCLTPSLYQLER